jgi:TRAP-type C4-dicarboxylate transport system substrate-binding protein
VKNLKVCVFVILGLLLGILSVLNACATTPESPATTPEKPVELSLAHMFPPESAPALVTDHWAEKIKNDSNGRLTIRSYPSDTLIKAPDMVSGVVEHAADIGYAFVYKPEGFELSTSFNFILAAPDTVTAGRIYDDIWQKYPKEMANEWNDVKVLWLSPSVPQFLTLIKKPAHTLADMKGLQIRVPAKELGDLITAWGATPVYMSYSDYLIAIDKGTVDGAIDMFSSILDCKLGGKVKYFVILRSGSLGCPTPVFVIMNKNSYNKLPSDLQKVIDDSLEWGKKSSIEMWAASDADSKAYFTGEGGEIIYLSPDEEAKWVVALNDVKTKYAQTLDAKGLPGTELLNFINERVKYYAEQ